MINFLVNASPKPLNVATLNFAGAYDLMIYRTMLGNICVALISRPIAKVKKRVFVVVTVYLVVLSLFAYAYFY